MSKALKLRGTTLGEGRPAVAVPIVAETEQGILEMGEKLADLGIDLVEWRADYFRDAGDPEAVKRVLDGLHAALGEIPVLFTFRTAEEGGVSSLAREDYVALCGLAGEYADAVDVQMLGDEETAMAALRAVHASGTPVIGSNHTFDGTPSREEMLRRLRRMQEMGAEVPKLAVMPNCKADVLALLSVTLEMAERYADRPIITMSMASDGIISRMAGEVFGSALSFGSVGTASAPGQIPAGKLRSVLEILHESMG
jgi:3-dehydroquinate dehydratase-1